MSHKPDTTEPDTTEPTTDERTLATDQGATPPHIETPNAPHTWASGKTFKQMYLDGDSPWPEEPLLQNDRHPFEIADEYLSLLGQNTRAARAQDEHVHRRLTGELEAATTALSSMDYCGQAAVLTRLIAHFSEEATNPRAQPPSPPKPSQVLPEQGRFNGPAPYFRRGRAYIQSLAPAFLLAAEGHGEFVSRRPDDADQLLRAVEASTDVTELQDFIAGATHELVRQLRLLISHPLAVADAQGPTD